MIKIESMIRKATSADAGDIVEIYNHFVVNSHTTFEMEPISTSDMSLRVQKVQNEFELPWLVLEINNQILGYAYATQWKARKAYTKTTETSIYLREGKKGNGYGRLLYVELLNQLKSLGYRAVIGGVALPNEASQALHKKLGFQRIGEFKEVGYKFDRWIDVEYWQLLFI